MPFEEFFRQKIFDFRKRLTIARSILNLDVVNWVYTMSKGGNTHIHVYVKNEFADLEILCLQQILGSDYVRGCFNLVRVRAGQKNWNLLFNGSYMSGIKRNGVAEGKTNKTVIPIEVMDSG